MGIAPGAVYADAMATGLVRPASERMIAGVCAGVAERFGVSVTPVRVLTVLLTVFFGVTIPVYMALWILIPREE